MPFVYLLFLLYYIPYNYCELYKHYIVNYIFALYIFITAISIVYHHNFYQLLMINICVLLFYLFHMYFICFYTLAISLSVLCV